MAPQDPDWIYQFDILSVPSLERKDKGNKRYRVYKDDENFEEIEALTAQEAMTKSGIEAPAKLLITNLRMDDIIDKATLETAQEAEQMFLMPQSLMNIVHKHRKIAEERKEHDPYFRHTHPSEPGEEEPSEKNEEALEAEENTETSGDPENPENSPENPELPTEEAEQTPEDSPNQDTQE